MNDSARNRAGGWSAPAGRRWVLIRRSVQLILLGTTLALFAITRTGADFATPGLANLLFYLDPLVAICALVAGSVSLAVMLSAVLGVLISVLFGRAFCGWLCPLGTMLDVTRRLTAPFTRKIHARTNTAKNVFARTLSRGRYAVLLIVAIGLIAGLPLLGVVEPFSILVRGLTPVAHAGGRLADSLGGGAHTRGPNRPFDEAGIHFIGAPVRPVEDLAPELAWLSGLILLAVLTAEVLQPRFWCRNLCPTGAFVGLLSRWSLLRRIPSGTCGACRVCVEVCKVGAFDRHNRLLSANCTLCMSCVAPCPASVIRFAPCRGPSCPPVPEAPADPEGGRARIAGYRGHSCPRVGAQAAGRNARGTEELETLDFSRRAFLISGAAGIAAPLLAGAHGRGLLRSPPTSDPWRLRPPGVAALGEDCFLTACVRCGECVKVCPTGTLQLAGLKDGLNGLFAPRLHPRRGPCEFGCSACATVCPTGAIPKLPLPVKQRTPVGVAVHDHARCLPWAKGGECRVCREHCPVAGKAIKLKLGRAADGGAVLLPFVDENLCIGCGTCEFVCPVEGDAGIRVVARESAGAMRAILQPGRSGVGWS